MTRSNHTEDGEDVTGTLKYFRSGSVSDTESILRETEESQTESLIVSVIQSYVGKQQPEEKPFSFRRLTRKEKEALFAACVTSFQVYINLSIYPPLLPPEAEEKGVSETITGWIFGIFAFAQVLFSPIVGRIIPITGCRFMMVAGLFVANACTCLFGCLTYVDTEDTIVTFVSLAVMIRIVFALGMTAASNASFVVMIQAFPGNFTTIFGIAEIFSGVGLLVGPAIGGVLFTAEGFILPYLVIGCFNLLCLPAVAYFVPNEDADPTPKAESKRSIKKLLSTPAAIVNSVAVLGSAVTWATLDPTLEPHLDSFDIGPDIIGLLFTVMAAAYALSSPIWGAIADRMIDTRKLLVPGFIAAGIGYMTLGPSPLFGNSLYQLWVTVVSMVVIGAASSWCCIPTFSVYLNLVQKLGYEDDTRTYGMVTSLWVAMYAIGEFIGPVIGGALNDKFGFPWAVTYTAGFCAFISLLLVTNMMCEGRCIKSWKTMRVPVAEEETEKTPLLGDRSVGSDFVNIPSDKKEVSV